MTEKITEVKIVDVQCLPVQSRFSVRKQVVQRGEAFMKSYRGFC